MPKKSLFLLVMVGVMLLGALFSLEIAAARANADTRGDAYLPNLVKTPTDTPTKRPTKTPRPTSTPTVTFTPLPTNTPNIFGTAGAQPTAFQAPPVSLGGGQGGGPGSELNFTINLTTGKLFVVDGFPGISLHSGSQGDYGYIKNHYAESTLEARWYVQVPQAGYYDVYAYIPPRSQATHTAVYRMFQNGTLNQGILVDQATHPDQWAYLGSYYFVQGPVDSQYLALTNQTNEDTATTVVLYSAIQVVYRP